MGELLYVADNGRVLGSQEELDSYEGSTQQATDNARFQHPEYPMFREWFRGLLKICKSCFERDILRNSMLVLWEEWKTQSKEDK